MKASKKIFSLVLGTSMFFTGMPECFAMMADDGQNSTPPSATDTTGEEAADYSRVIAAAVPAPAPSDSLDMTDVDISPLFRDIVPSEGTASSRPGTLVPLPPEGAGAVQPQIVEGVAADAGTASSRPGTPTSSLADSAAHDAEPEVGHGMPPSNETLRRSALPGTLSGEGETSGKVVAPQPRVSQEGENLADSLDGGPAAGAGTDLSRSSSRSSDGSEMSDAGSSDDESDSSSAASSRSALPGTLSGEGETFGDDRGEETVAPLAPILPSVAPGIIAEAVHISAPVTEKSSFFAKTVDVAVVAPPFLSEYVVTNFVSRVWNPTAGKCTVDGTKRKVKFDLIGSNNLSSLKNYRVIIFLFNSGFEQWRLAEESFLRDIQPINSSASVIFVSVNSGTLAPDVVWDMSNRAAELTTVDRKVAYATDADTNMNPTFGFLPFIVRLFDEADPNFSPLTLTPSQITGAKRAGTAAACVGGAWIAMKIFNKLNLKKPEKRHKKDKNLSKTKSPTSSKHFKKMNAIY